jgi:hypothetical protein
MKVRNDGDQDPGCVRRTDGLPVRADRAEHCKAVGKSQGRVLLDTGHAEHQSCKNEKHLKEHESRVRQLQGIECRTGAAVKSNVSEMLTPTL